MGDQTKPARVSRRNVLAAAAGATPLMALMSGSAEAKMAQTAVKYQPTPKDGAQCSTCSHFVAPGSCTIVVDPIAPEGWCQFYAKP